MKEKTELQLKIQKVRKFLPQGEKFAIHLAQVFDVKPQYVRMVWQGVRQNPAILEATNLAIESAEKQYHADMKNKVSALVS